MSWRIASWVAVGALACGGTPRSADKRLDADTTADAGTTADATIADGAPGGDAGGEPPNLWITTRPE
jgi:hypothetical protein